MASRKMESPPTASYSLKVNSFFTKYYSKTCFKRPHKNRQNKDFNDKHVF